MEYWKIGMLECWVKNAEFFLFYENRNSEVLIDRLNCFKPIIPLFHYSIIPKGRNTVCL